MAILGDFSKGYTKTGGSGLDGASGTLSYIPFISQIPILGTPIVALTGFVGTAIESVKWLLRGKIASAVTVAAAGTVSTAVNSAASIGGVFNPVWWINAGSGITTGRTIGTHARKLTEAGVGAITGAVGLKPQVLRSYAAGIGSIGTGMPQAGPGRYVTQVANSRGEDPNAAYARLNSNQADHLAALSSASRSASREM